MPQAAWYSVVGWEERPEAKSVLRFYSSLVAPILAARKEHASVAAATDAADYLLDKLVWGVTTLTDGPRHARIDLRYISAGAKAVFEEFEWAASRRQLSEAKRKLLPRLRHEHVIPRSTLIRQLVSGQGAISLADALGCVVTIDEHGALQDAPPGWDRYRAARVRVWDRAGSGAWLGW